MKTDFHAILRHYDTGLSREEIDQMSQEEARGYYFANKGTLKKKPVKKPTIIRVCFTGFTTDEKESLMEIAAERHLWVVQSVTTDLDILVCGPNAGPKKLEKAKKQGCQVITEQEFRNRLAS